MTSNPDKVIIGAGIYGLYAALYAAKKGQKVVVLEFDDVAFGRASYVNQARVHNGYHYPRSFSTAVHSKEYYKRFKKDYGFCINEKFDKIYATPNRFSWTDAQQFQKFCKDTGVKCERIDKEKYFKTQTCEEAFLSEECTFDANVLKQYFLTELEKTGLCKMVYNARIASILPLESSYSISLQNGEKWNTPFLLNATYASINQVLEIMKLPLFDVKYELCEMILCKVSDNLKNIGVTMMDGPFFSLMPFGQSGLHSLSAVPYTPHKLSKDRLPTFNCQTKDVACSSIQLNNCNTCINKPQTAWPMMHSLAKKYLIDDVEITYHSSIFAIKAILNASEIDDSRPTMIKQFSAAPYFYSVLSGKINTIYDLDAILC